VVVLHFHFFLFCYTNNCNFNYGNYGFVIRNASDWKFYNCEFDNGLPQYVYWTDVKLKSCNVAEAYPEFESKAITSDSGFSHLIIEYCTFKNGFDAIGIKDNSTDVKITNSYFVNFRDDAIDLRAGIDSVEISYNILWGIGSGISMTGTDNSTIGNVYIHHNIIDNSIYIHGGREGNCHESNWPVWTVIDPFGSHTHKEIAYWKIYNNTIVTRKSGYNYGSSGAKGVLGNPGKYMLNNIFLIMDDRIVFRKDTASNGSTYDGNIMYRYEQGTLPFFYIFGDGNDYYSLNEFRENSGTDWEINGLQINPELDTTAIIHHLFDTLIIRERYRPHNSIVYTIGSVYDTLAWPDTDSIYYRGALPPGENYWLGSNTSWSDTSNWSKNIVPDNAYDVIVPTNPQNGNYFPVISDTLNASCHKLILNNNASIVIYGKLYINKN